MNILKRFNLKFSSSIPVNIGDFYYSQDMIRDYRFFQDQIGQLAYDLFGTRMPIKITGGVVTQGSGDTLNITAGNGWTQFNVTYPNSLTSLPGTVSTADLMGVPVAWTQQTNMAIASATLNGSAVNYVKVQYNELDGNTRTYAKKSGTYSYESIPSYTFVVDTNAPTVYDLCLTTFKGTAGGAFTIADPTILYPYWSTISSIPVGTSIDYSGTTIPTGWLIEDGASLLRASYPALWAAMSASKGTVTISIASPGEVSLTTHGLITGDCISLTTTGALPTGLSVSTNYYVIYENANTFWLATTYANAIAGTKINTSGSQSGTHTLMWNPWGIVDATHFNIPDMQGLASEGSGQQAYTAWAGANYLGRLGQYKQDIMQGWQLGASADSTGARNYWSKLRERDYYNNAGAAAGCGLMLSTTSDQGISSMLKAMDDGTHGTPRTGYITAGPRAGKYKIIKVI